VLAVDDDAGALDAIAGALGTLGYEVWQAPDGASALALADQQQPDVILLDINMPGMDGFEVCQLLKQQPETQLIPVVFLTGQGGREARIAALDAGATDFLNKPCELTELELRVRNLVNFRRLIEELESAEQILFSIARTIEARDEGTGDHCERLAREAVRFGRRLGFGEDDLRALKRGGYLHDLGKVGISDAILLKPGCLTEREFAVMRRHVEIGHAICSPLRSLRSVLPIIRHHHERWDGTGYPEGLRGAETPLLARVFQQVDIFDALTSDRCYREAMSVERALEVMAEETAMGWLDPELSAEFRAMTEGDGAPAEDEGEEIA